MENYRYLDMDNYNRKDHFEYFNSLAYPYVGITVNVDFERLLGKIKAEKLPFFLTVCYCVSRAANRVPEFRQRIENGRIIEFERCRASYTAALDDGTFCYCTLEDDMLPFRDYITYGEKAQEEAKRKGSISEDKESVQDLFFISTLPWISYQSLIQPVPSPADSNPRITWGKYFIQEGKAVLPVSVLCNHALIDGRHIAGFYSMLEEEFSRL